ncbi:hypothetical protein BDDG_13563 [Blastomyces dermatitidis ATCC 18188]|uniref:Uncharacterized protein n=1 Tax=Ajellomyces dermatitidis (strain ATCC 18188 / CBS 674.68) TaxID=653446 RepID=A0A0J9ET11_AJEDA|nr:hypothetical protein BDDG_13563 [Blastomyces dermatitidis ATCC 18188]
MIVKEQSDEFNNKYKDSVEGISEMSDNAESSSSQNNNDSVSEKTHMRLEIARLQHEVKRMKTGRSENEELSADLMNYHQQKSRTSALIKILNEFRNQVRSIKKSVVLTDSANYSI